MNSAFVITTSIVFKADYVLASACNLTAASYKIKACIVYCLNDFKGQLNVLTLYKPPQDSLSACNKTSSSE